jgi:hypothetical protein
MSYQVNRFLSIQLCENLLGDLVIDCCAGSKLNLLSFSVRSIVGFHLWSDQSGRECSKYLEHANSKILVYVVFTNLISFQMETFRIKT